MLACLALASAAAAPQGSLLYVVGTSMKPFKMGLVALDLQMDKETMINSDLGSGLSGSFGCTTAGTRTQLGRCPCSAYPRSSPGGESCGGGLDQLGGALW